MNTIPETTTSAFFADATDFARLHTHWRGLIQSGAGRALRPEHFLLYQALRLRTRRSWRTVASGLGAASAPFLPCIPVLARRRSFSRSAGLSPPRHWHGCGHFCRAAYRTPRVAPT